MGRSMLLSGLCLCLFAVSARAGEETVPGGSQNLLTAAVAWKQTAAEYRALYYQGYNIAKMHLDNALRNRKPDDKPLAVISDVDDTIISPITYWGYLINNNRDFFDDPIWDRWIAADKFVVLPGALEFMRYCKEKNVEVFYVTNRDQGENTYQLAVQNLRTAGFPYIDDKHLIVQRETSNKEMPQKAIAVDYDVVLMLGDNLNDFQRKYYVKDVDERLALMEEDKALFGTKFIVFPNPTDGHWMRAIFGDSEPPPSDENRAIFKSAATRSAWSE